MRFVAMLLIPKEIWFGKDGTEKERAIVGDINDKLRLYRMRGWVQGAEWGPSALISKTDGSREPVNRVGDVDFEKMLLEVKKEKAKLWDIMNKKREEVSMKLYDSGESEENIKKKLDEADKSSGFIEDKESFANNIVPLSTLVVIAKDGQWYDPRNEEMNDWIASFDGFYKYLDPDDVIALLNCEKN